MWFLVYSERVVFVVASRWVVDVACRGDWVVVVVLLVRARASSCRVLSSPSSCTNAYWFVALPVFGAVCAQSFLLVF